jgi:hypothetical protein
MTIFATNGAKTYIGGTITVPTGDLDQASFAGQVWIEVGETENLGTFGDTAAEITFDSIGANRTRRLKGTRNAGNMELVCGLDYADAGQLALIAAEKTIHDYAFRVVFNDAPPGGTPSERMFAAKVASAAEAADAANNVVKLNATLWINSNVVRVSAGGAGAAPDNTVLPAITGTAEVDETLTATPGTWTGAAPIIHAFQWFADGEAIPGATGTTYVPVAGDVGKVISVMVTAANVSGSRSAISAATSAVTS